MTFVFTTDGVKAESLSSTTVPSLIDALSRRHLSKNSTLRFPM